MTPADRFSWLLPCAALALLIAAPLRAQQPTATGGGTATALPARLDSDRTVMMEGLTAARGGQHTRLRAMLDSASSQAASDAVLWLAAEYAPETLKWSDLEAARTRLTQWPYRAHRADLSEKLIGRSGLSAEQTLAWFGDREPATLEGASALTEAHLALGRKDKAEQILRSAWRSRVGDAALQADILARRVDLLRPQDHEARASTLIYAGQLALAQAMLPLLPSERQGVMQARLALHRGGPGALALVEGLPEADRDDPGLVYERVIALRERGDIGPALQLAPKLPVTLPDEKSAQKLWKRGSLMVAALQMGDVAGAYHIAARSGLLSGPEAADAQFAAGWIALSRMKDPQTADTHFARLEQSGPSPITRSRALYWRARAAEAEGDTVAAQLFYEQAAGYYTTFYGQLSATRLGRGELAAGHDPEVRSADKDRFEGLSAVRMARILAVSGDRRDFQTFILGLQDSLSEPSDQAQLIDLARNEGEYDLAMRLVRAAARRGVVMPERGYPLLNAPQMADGAEPPLVLGVARQESNFNPSARSPVGARGLMQLMPATAAAVSRRAGMGRGSLEDPDYNLRVGSVFLGQLVRRFGGSYVLAAAAYNAGPGRPEQWLNVCGDPRKSIEQAVDFIECIPFSETRDYVMRVVEATQIYRARLSGGKAALALATDVGRAPMAGVAAGSALAAAAPPPYSPAQPADVASGEAAALSQP